MRLLSWRHWRFGEIALVVFIVTQALDGVLTYMGIRRFGTGIEANALITWYALSVGAGRALIGAKAFAVGCAAILHIGRDVLEIKERQDSAFTVAVENNEVEGCELLREELARRKRDQR